MEFNYPNRVGFASSGDDSRYLALFDEWFSGLQPGRYKLSALTQSFNDAAIRSGLTAFHYTKFGKILARAGMNPYRSNGVRYSVKQDQSQHQAMDNCGTSGTN